MKISTTYLLLFILVISSTVNAQPTSGLVAYWPMNGNFTDAGPNNINGTNYGATSTTNAGNTAGSAMSFLNPNATVVQYGTHPVNANLNFGVNQDFTVSFTAYVNSPWIHTGGIYDNNINYGGYGIWVWQISGNNVFQFIARNNSISSSNITLGSWIKVCAVQASGTLKMYINGTLNASGTIGSATPNYTYAGRFGTMFYNGQTPPEYNGLNGKIDELRIYNRALTDAEIAQIAALPVKLTAFTANRHPEGNLLRWSTQFESNSSHFTVQHSEDGVNFTNIATVQAANNTSTTSNYNYLDKQASRINNKSVAYYRLEMVDKDGKSEYSAVIAIRQPKQEQTISLLENPVVKTLRLYIKTTGTTDAVITVTDAIGRPAFSRKLPLIPGDNYTAFDAGQLGKGMFIVKVEMNGESKSIPFIR